MESVLHQGLSAGKKQQAGATPVQNHIALHIVSNGGTGVTNLMVQRLSAEYKNLASDQDAHCSIIIDEMAIQEKFVYDKQVDPLFGLVDTDSAALVSGPPVVANKLSCFVLRGLATACVIPATHSLVCCLKHEQLLDMVTAVIRAVEEAGFSVVRLVTDNHWTDTAMFKSVSGCGTLQHMVPHPLRGGDLLFPSFDPSCIIKSLRNSLLELGNA